MNKPYQHVSVGILIDVQGQVLLAQRPQGKPWAGWWEFPGGKIEVGETPYQALVRELSEELGITVTQANPWLSFEYEYPKTRVKLEFFLVRAWQGQPKGLEQQRLIWVMPAQAHTVGDLLPASLKPIYWLSLPVYYAITPALTGQAEVVSKCNYLKQIERIITKQPCLLQFRQPCWHNEDYELQWLFEETVARCHQAGVKVLVNSCHPKAWWSIADGVHLRQQDALQLTERPLPDTKLVGMSTHQPADITLSQRLETDLIVLGHVCATPSHPDQAPLGWDAFNTMALQSACPVYALGGVTLSDLEFAQQQGAHGIAGIRLFFNV